MISDAEMRTPVSFPRWVEALERAPGVGTERKSMFRCAIMGYLQYLKTGHRRASLASAKAYFDEEKAAGKERKEEREAVRWFFRAARQEEMSKASRTPGDGKKNTGRVPVSQGKGACTDSVEDVPAVIVPEKMDMGSTPWERKLVARLRVGHYQWRTETSYREWARRFCAWLGTKTLEAAGDEDIKKFLTELAVKHRLSASMQRQALNAVVYLFREVAGREPGVSVHSPLDQLG